MSNRRFPSIVTEPLAEEATESRRRTNNVVSANGDAPEAAKTVETSNVNRMDTAPQTVPFNSLNCMAQKLLRDAVAAREHAYCPYSNFPVGAAVLADDGSVTGGCNVENCSFTVGLCAERTAYVKAISEGKSKFKAVAVVALHEKFMVTPCGACRQFMSEFGDVMVYCSRPDLGDVFTTNLLTLIPHTFAL